MILDEFQGNVLKETLFMQYGLPVYCVIPAKGNGTRQYFRGETAYQDAQRYFNDVNLRAVYK
jgi:hypothetical protein